MRHHGRAEDADGQQHAVGALQAAGSSPCSERAARRRRPAAGRTMKPRQTIAEQPADRELEAPVAARLQREDPERDDRRDQARGQRRHAEQQVAARSPRRRTRPGRWRSRSPRPAPTAPADRAAGSARGTARAGCGPSRCRSWPTGTARASRSRSRRRSPRSAGSRTWRRRRCWWRSCRGRCRRPPRRTPARAAPRAPLTGPRARMRRSSDTCGAPATGRSGFGGCGFHVWLNQNLSWSDRNLKAVSR